MVKKLGAWGLLAGFWLAAPAAHADSSPDGGTRLSFVRSASATHCIAAPVLEREIARRMRRDPFTSPVRQWIEVVVEHDVDGYAVHLFERDSEGKTLGTRELHSETEDCHQLDDAMVLAIALIIDPTAQLEPATARIAEAPPTPEPGASPLAASPTPHTTAQENAAEARSTARERAQPASAPSSATAFVAADALIVNGVLPGLAPGAELTTQLPVAAQGRTTLRLSALYLPEASQHTSFGEFGYGLSALEVGACRVVPTQRVRWFACTGLGAGAIHAVVHDPAPLRPGDRLWLAVRTEVGVAVRLAGPVWVQARVFDLIALRRWEFRVRTETSANTAFAQAALMPGAALGVGLHFD